jgi:hypothetical protein
MATGPFACPLITTSMSRIYSADLHGNENASIEFGAAIARAVQGVRAQIDTLATSRKADEYAPGAIHALRKLCEGEDTSGQIHQVEVEQWHATFAAWFQRVKKHFSATLAKKFQANAEDDFRTILKCACRLPDNLWRNDLPKRYTQISFPNDAALDAARDAADEKHPVELGSALHKYLEACVADLVGGKRPAKAKPAATLPTATESLAVRFTPGGKQSSLSIDNFGCFDTAENLEQDIVVTAYDVEDAVKKYLKASAPKILKSLRFDCESSLFVVRSADVSALGTVVTALYVLAADHELFAG